MQIGEEAMRAVLNDLASEQDEEMTKQQKFHQKAGEWACGIFLFALGAAGWFVASATAYHFAIELGLKEDTAWALAPSACRRPASILESGFGACRSRPNTTR